MDHRPPERGGTDGAAITGGGGVLSIDRGWLPANAFDSGPLDAAVADAEAPTTWTGDATLSYDREG